MWPMRNRAAFPQVILKEMLSVHSVHAVFRTALERSGTKGGFDTAIKQGGGLLYKSLDD